MKKYLIQNLSNNGFLRNVNPDTSKHTTDYLEYNAKISMGFNRATLFDNIDNAKLICEESMSKTTFSGCFLTIVEVYINDY